MGLNRVQKRNLAIVLVSQALDAIEDWDKFKQEDFAGVPEGALENITQDDVRQRFAGWLQYLPGKPAASMLLGEEVTEDEGEEVGDDDQDDRDAHADHEEDQNLVYAQNDPNA